MKLYQALTQITLDDHLIDAYTEYTVTVQAKSPLNYTPEELYSYIDSVLAPGSFHEENNLRFVSDPSFISSNYDFNANPFTAQFTAFEDKVAFSQKVVDDLNRHLSVNIDGDKHEFQLIFVD
ncbi:hypothetical protein FC83_GL002008 [Agrilactobacillus composti DSM 18527 = JCM 14202]|uniref:Uncharacterized protein n=1 Tax=Agrilactobacillus composti DSM 18527 = JCM 14202 TaxID=1423734 RepID=X0PP43_9LACO|nr:hypothetical protein [Agrilactobacillus composti]KRM34870.1 hypothetical protein FC83_GL002008 [Agrilactobacillus composti DSM 18527 = JCM 14202]GAF38741.1 hypothetical protein JCM14202_569 [Agrilactobacillus composti DSM 18527 = JCM 14202]